MKKSKFEITINGVSKSFYPEQISGKVLKRMENIAESHLGFKVTDAVITVPAYFQDSQKGATIDAAKIGSLNVPRIINEPTAAALAYRMNLDEKAEAARNVLIFDLGRGSFDVAVLKVDFEGIEMKSVGGDDHLDGEYFVQNLVDYCLAKFQEENGILSLEVKESVEVKRSLRRFRTKCEKLKIHFFRGLSTVEIDDFLCQLDLKVEVTRDEFESMNNGRSEKNCVRGKS